MDPEAIISEILDKLTEEVKIEDAAIMVAGFYAGMNGYTPVSAIMKMFIESDIDDKSLLDAALRSVFGIPGLAITGVYEFLTQADKDTAKSFENTRLSRMDPRNINSAYLYDRMMVLKHFIDNLDTMILAKQGEINGLNLAVLQLYKDIDDLKHQIANEVEEAIIQELRNQINQKLRQIDGYNQDIQNLNNDITNMRNQYSLYEPELGEIKLILKKKELALGLVGMIEAYTITRPGTIQNFGEILKGIGEIVPL